MAKINYFEVKVMALYLWSRLLITDCHRINPGIMQLNRWLMLHDIGKPKVSMLKVAMLLCYC